MKLSEIDITEIDLQSALCVSWQEIHQLEAKVERLLENCTNQERQVVVFSDSELHSLNSLLVQMYYIALLPTLSGFFKSRVETVKALNKFRLSRSCRGEH